MCRKLSQLLSIFRGGNRRKKLMDECVADVNFGGMKGHLEMAGYYIMHPRDFWADKIGIISFERNDCNGRK